MCSELPSAHQAKMVESGHTANIFGVKFIPATGDMKAASGAMDKTVIFERRMRKLTNLENACFSYQEQGRARNMYIYHPNINLMNRLDSMSWREASVAEFSRHILIE